MNKMNNKGFSLVELIVVIAIMAVLMGVLAPTLIGNIEKSRETKDLNALDSVYQAVNHALATEAGAKEAANGFDVKLSDLLSGSTYPSIKADVAEEVGTTAPSLSASCNVKANAEIYVKVDTDLKVTVYCKGTGSGSNVIECAKTKDDSGQLKKMEVKSN